MSTKGRGRAPIVTILNMKGGVGKTTISAHVFGLLWERKKVSTLLLDLDPQFNLTQTLYEQPEYDALLEKRQTILRVLQPDPVPGLFEVSNAPKPPPQVEELADILEGDSPGSEPLAIVPGDFELTKYTLITEARRLKIVQDRFIEFVRSAQEAYKVICIDCNPSSSFLTLCALLPCTHLIVPVRPDRYSVRGLEMLMQFMDDIPLLIDNPQVGIIFNGVSRNDTTIVETEIRTHSKFGSQVFTARIPKSDILQAATTYTGFAWKKPVAYRKGLETDLAAVVDEIANWLKL